MDLPDVNICLAAFREDHPDHQRCRQWLTAAAASGRRLGMSPQVLSAVVRISTQGAFMGGMPSLLEDALAFGDRVLGHPGVHHVQPGSGHWTLFASLCLSAHAKGRLAADAWFAALAMEHDCTWITLDADYGRISGLRWQRL